MFSFQKLWFVFVMVGFLKNHALAQSVAKAAVNTTAEETRASDLSKLALITDDVIHDNVEKDIKKVIRVSPLDLPALKDDPENLNMDSSLYKIQPLKPFHFQRKYINMQRSKPLNNQELEAKSTLNKEPSLRRLTVFSSAGKFLKPKHQPKKKHLHFLYNQNDLTGNLLSKSMPVHVAPGAYPVYYVIAKTNGRFGKYPLKSFASPQAFMKYLQKNKLEKLPALKTYEESV